MTIKLKLSILSLAVLLPLAVFAQPLNASSAQLPEMPYVNQSDITPSDVTSRDFIAATDDNKDGTPDADVWAAIQVSVQNDIDGILGQRFTVPFTDPLPAIVKLAAKTFAIEKVYTRRGLSGESNPVTVNANAMRKMLVAIATGVQELAPGVERAEPSAVAITGCSPTFSKRPAI